MTDTGGCRLKCAGRSGASAAQPNAATPSPATAAKILPNFLVMLSPVIGYPALATYVAALARAREPSRDAAHRTRDVPLRSRGRANAALDAPHLAHKRPEPSNGSVRSARPDRPRELQLLRCRL